MGLPNKSNDYYSDVGVDSWYIAGTDESPNSITLPDDSAAFDYFNSGNAKRDMGLYAQAVDDYNNAIKAKPDFVDAYNARALAKLAKGDYNDAIAMNFHWGV